jgi:hypothetical protein
MVENGKRARHFVVPVTEPVILALVGTRNPPCWTDGIFPSVRASKAPYNSPHLLMLVLTAVVASTDRLNPPARFILFRRFPSAALPTHVEEFAHLIIDDKPIILTAIMCGRACAQYNCLEARLTSILLGR